ncbi:ATP-binding protein [Halogeometricum sp. S1BR25-6]|uniref:histidine kinase n=1 Tax=Halogeometricum salsisoli TaxID=2950536 RepID=A0ABU2GI62_9EURY|nr:histidine kinase N-terminal 7TM domain-containing protein [Halogeometricum sp. S1BR25-6]MDS0300527.1 ATP-binding protein [Halogeometricum sp. S1BR25-6]
MSWQQTLYAYPALFAALLSVFLGVYALSYANRNGRTPVLTAFICASVALSLWSGFSAVKLLSTDPAVKLLAYRLLYVGAAPIGAFSLLFALSYTDRDEWLRPPVVAALLSVPALYVALVFANPAGLAIESTRLVERGGLLVLRVDVGPAHLLLQLLYNAALSLAALAIVAVEAFRLGREYVPQALLLGVGIGAPLLVVGATYAGIPPFTADHVNLVPASTAVTAAALGVALFRYRLLDLPPIAYTTALEASPDGVLVVDRTGRVVHANGPGERFFAAGGAGVGDAFEAGFPDVDLAKPETDTVRVDGKDGGGADERFLSVRTQTLDRRGQHVGWVVVLRDVTTLQERKRAIEEQNERLTLLNQIVRHDIRNDMSVVLGNAHLLESLVDGEEAETRLETIVRNGEHAVELTETMRGLMQTMLNDASDLEAVSLREVLTHEVDSVRAGDDECTLRISEDVPDVCVLADDALGTVFRNLLTNGIRHRDTETPTVTVSATDESDAVVVAVADDGPGVPPERREEIFGRGNKGLESPGTGIGLYLVETLVSGYGGDVWVEDNDPRGSVFFVRLPKAPSEQNPTAEPQTP